MNNQTKEIYLPSNIDRFNYQHQHSPSNRQTSFENNTIKVAAASIKLKPLEIDNILANKGNIQLPKGLIGMTPFLSKFDYN